MSLSQLLLSELTKLTNVVMLDNTSISCLYLHYVDFAACDIQTTASILYVFSFFKHFRKCLTTSFMNIYQTQQCLYLINIFVIKFVVWVLLWNYLLAGRFKSPEQK